MDDTEEPHPCDDCSKIFYNKKSFRQHLRTVHGDTVFQCPKCDNAYKTNRALSNHIQSAHSEERNYVCPDCGMAFKNNTILLSHKRTIHPSEEMMEKRKCKECGHQVSRIGYLASHMTQHKICVWYSTANKIKTRDNVLYPKTCWYTIMPPNPVNPQGHLEIELKKLSK